MYDYYAKCYTKEYTREYPKEIQLVNRFDESDIIEIKVINEFDESFMKTLYGKDGYIPLNKLNED